MRNQVLRDVLAGCAGVLAVAAAIGLPKASAPAPFQQQAPAPAQHSVVLLPYLYFSRGAPVAPSAPRVRITTRP
jgi:hypothetical protein